MKPRYKERIALRAVVTFRTGSHVREGQLVDITSPGCRIESSAEVQQGQSLHLTIFLRELESPLFIQLGVVRWTKGKRFGVEFIKMDEVNRLALDRYMVQHLVVSGH